MKHRPAQVALVVVLVVIVGLTIGVAVISRSVTSTSISTQEEERARAFSAAEAGIEDALRQDLAGLTTGGFLINPGDTQVGYTVTKLTNISAEVDPGQAITIDWSLGTGTSAGVSWNACAKLAATEITSGGGVTHSVETGTSKTFNKGGNRMVRLRFIGCSTPVTISGNDSLSFYEIDSTGTSGQAASRVKVTRSEPAAIGLMDFAVFSGGNIQ